MVTSRQSKRVTGSELERQRAYVKKVLDEGFEFDLMIADAFVRGIRDIGYKSSATALDELIDNSVQAGADKVLVWFDSSEAKVSRIAIFDNGHGMDPDMIRLSVIWGGTHRENDRAGFGRYGYGLPSASISQGRRFSVYSLVEGGELHGVTLDVDELGNGAYTNQGRIVVPDAVPAELPSWLRKVASRFDNGAALTHGTVVVLERLDRLTWKTTAALERNLLEHLGITYRNFLRQVSLSVNEKTVEPVDPIFTTPGNRYYDLNSTHAELQDPMAFDVKDSTTGKPLGTVKVRFSYMPPAFLKNEDGSGNNARLGIRKENNGIIVLRNGRQIDVVAKTPWTVIQNNDRYWGVEVDFPAALDEEFSITTSKQQIAISDRLWELLKQQGVLRVITQLRTRYDREAAEFRAERESDPEQKRQSEQAMEEAAHYKTHRPGGEPEDRAREAEEALAREVRRRADESGVPVDVVEREIEAEIVGHPYVVQQERLPGAPFYRVEQRGGQRVLWLNTDHRFYRDVYAGPSSTPYLRSALEVLLFVMGECELDSDDDRRLFYQSERGEWSTRLNVALDRLNNIEGVTDIMAASVEREETDHNLRESKGEPIEAAAG